MTIVILDYLDKQGYIAIGYTLDNYEFIWSQYQTSLSEAIQFLIVNPITIKEKLSKIKTIHKEHMCSFEASSLEDLTENNFPELFI